MANVLSITVNGTRANPSSTATAVGLPVFAIQDILPFTGPQPLTGITILTIVRMKARGTKVTHDNYLSATATATVITAAG
ncbi:MAG: hypothetical protein ABI208_06810 [Ginsengibacter sp.]